MEGEREIQTQKESKEKLRDVTLVFLIKKSNEAISNICLAMKKRGFGAGRWNGAGGKVEREEGIEDAVKREAKEEIGVEVKSMGKVAELTFYFPHNPAWDQVAHVYFSEEWGGEPEESEEMKPAWFSTPEIPFSSMWATDAFWLPEVLSGKLVKATFVFGEGDVVAEKDLQIVESL